MRRNQRRTWLAPAADIIAKFKTDEVPGTRRLSRLLNISETRIYNWMYAKEDGGAGGFIPVDHHRTILTAARELGISLTPAELTGLQEFDEPKPARKSARKSTRQSSAQGALGLIAAE